MGVLIITDKFLSATIQHEVQKMFKENQETIVSYLAGDNLNARFDPDVTSLIIRSMTLSVQMAVQLTIKTLEGAKIIQSVPDFIAFAQMINDEIIKSSNEKEEQSKN